MKLFIGLIIGIGVYLLALLCFGANVELQPEANSAFSGLITNPNTVFSVPPEPKPGYLSPVVLPPFNTKITRIAGDPGSTIRFESGSGFWGTIARHHYMLDEPWNSNGTLIAMQNNGSPRELFLDGNTYQPKYGLCPNYNLGEDRWNPSPDHPYERINVKGDELMWFDVVHCVKTRSWRLPFPVKYFGPGKGNPSRDGRYVALTDQRRMFVVDMDAYPGSRFGPSVDLVSDCGLPGECRVSSVSISPTGKYAVVHYKGDYERVYNVDPATLAMTPRPMPRSYPNCTGDPSKGFIYNLGHPDMALNPFDGDAEVMVGQEHCHNRGRMIDGKPMGGVVMVRLRDGAVTSLTNPVNEAYPDHISAQSFDRPGWVYVTYYPQRGKRFNDEIVAVKMDGSGSVERICQARSVFKGCYRCESHAVPSRDGKRVIFASNWGDFGGPIQDYVVDLTNTSDRNIEHRTRDSKLRR
jgi:hypothetical protein